jgi:predicted transcriptional regulator YdeE
VPSVKALWQLLHQWWNHSRVYRHYNSWELYSI